MLQLDARSQTILDLKSQLDNIKDDLLPNLDSSVLVNELNLLALMKIRAYGSKALQ